MALTLDARPLIDIIADGQGDIGGNLLPAPEGIARQPPDDGPEDMPPMAMSRTGEEPA